MEYSRLKLQVMTSTQDRRGKQLGRLLKQVSGVYTIKLLCELIKNVQKHRGASIACLHGDAGFGILKSGINNNLSKLFHEFQDSEAQNCLIPRRWVNVVINDWQTIESDWRDDGVIDNYELHNHLVDTLSRRKRLCIKDYIFSGIDVDDNLSMILCELADKVELLARLRGLCTHVTVSGYCDHDSEIRIAYLSREVNKEFNNINRKLRDVSYPVSSFRKLEEVSLQEINLGFLLDTIHTEILAKRVQGADGKLLFDLATEAIDFYWQIIAVFQDSCRINSNYFI